MSNGITYKGEKNNFSRGSPAPWVGVWLILPYKTFPYPREVALCQAQ